VAGDDWISPEEQQILGGAAIRFVNDWLEGVLGAGDFDAAWRSMDDRLRLATAQSWILLEDDRPEVDAADRDLLAAVLAAGDTTHPLWDEFAGWRIVRWRNILGEVVEWYSEGMGVLSRVQAVPPDLLVVSVTGSGGAPRWVPPGEAVHAWRIVVRMVHGEFRIASLGGRLPVPGWPPGETDAVPPLP
jgi:hypothetical protein